jgi:pimeloyl-ACP methyl ester carboxylesterase
MGLSDFQPDRRLADWPDDVLQLAAGLGLERFAVLGISGGGPYAAVCAWKLSDQLTRAGIVSSLAPLDVPGVIAGMGRRNRLSFQLIGRVAVLRRALFASMTISARRHPDRLVERGVGAAAEAAELLRAIRDRTGLMPDVCFTWTEGNPLLNLLRFLFVPAGEIAPVTREILREAEPEPDHRPRSRGLTRSRPFPHEE